MRAVTVRPGSADSLRVEDVDDPVPGPGELLVDGLALGVCGTDREIAAGRYGWAPDGRDRLILGHESLGRVRAAPPDSGFAAGDLAVGVVRRPDPQPCGACAHGEFDMCRNGRYTERGIKSLDGYGSQCWTVSHEYAVGLRPSLEPVGMLLEPTSVVAKAWEQTYRIGQRSWFEPRRVVVTGAGPIGLLAALLSVQKGLDTHVLDRVRDGPKPALVQRLGATYHHGDVGETASRLRPDIVIEATGAAAVIIAVAANTAGYGIVCLTGVPPKGGSTTLALGTLDRTVVLENDAVFGSVNANLRHYRQAAAALAAADHDWLAALISRRVPLNHAAEAFVRRDGDVKVVIDLQG